MPERVVPKYVPIMELVFASAYKTEDSAGQKRNIVFSNLTGRRINRVHFAGIVTSVNEYEGRDGTKNYRIRIDDGYTITVVTRSAAIADIAKKNIGNFVEVTARGFARRDGRAGWRAEQLAPTDPENFVAIRTMALKNLQDDLGTLDPDEIKKKIDEALEILLDEERLNEEFKKILSKVKKKSEKTRLSKLRGAARMKFVAKQLGIPEVFVQYIDDKIAHEAWVMDNLSTAEEENEKGEGEEEEYEVAPIA